LQAGEVFLAWPIINGDGRMVGDGRQYILAALEKGASAVLYDSENFSWPAGADAGAGANACGGFGSEFAHIPCLAVPDLAWHAGEIANAFYARPDQAMLTIAVTGTNGKTSCALWLGRAFSRQAPACVIGTLGVAILNKGDGEFEANGYTTPEAVMLQNTLARVRQAGVQTVAMEASSIGLEQGRMRGMHLDIALFTNLTRDHLDFHGDMDAYEASKNILFDWPGLRHAVVNLDDAMGVRLVHRLARRVDAGDGGDAVATIGYTINDSEPDASAWPQGLQVLRASHLRSRATGTEFHLSAPQGQCQLKTRLLGKFNISNALGVLGVMLASGMDFNAAVKAVEALEAAPGRMQQMGGIDAPLVVVDYAHTPDALEKTLLALRPVTQERGGQLWCVFGCGGDRDPGKRPQMGAVAQLADHIMVTSDNPRGEEPDLIIQHIAQGISKPAQMIADRAAAILSAIKHAAKPDVVLIAGKGHENYQEIKGKKLPFSDTEQAALALATRPTMRRV
jgi:UDP-N-acetylmuramoyl-L-alanyl-D-glutamate--2,6-diaminopimelate ligase